MDKNKTNAKKIRSADQYPGIAVNVSDQEKDTDKLVKERTRTLNNNPRNSTS